MRNRICPICIRGALTILATLAIWTCAIVLAVYIIRTW